MAQYGLWHVYAPKPLFPNVWEDKMIIEGFGEVSVLLFERILK
jgi:hypothetical protein